MHSIFDALVTAAAADVAGHRFNYLIAGRFWILYQQRGRLHDLAGLAIAALRNVVCLPGKLDRVRAVGAETLDRDDLVPMCIGQNRQAGAYRFAVHEYGTTTTDAMLTTNMRPGQV